MCNVFYAIMKLIRVNSFRGEKNIFLSVFFEKMTNVVYFSVRRPNIINNTQTNEMYEWKEVCKGKKIISFQLFDCSPSLHVTTHEHELLLLFTTHSHFNIIFVHVFTIFSTSNRTYTCAIVCRDRYGKRETKIKKSTIFP